MKRLALFVLAAGCAGSVQAETIIGLRESAAPMHLISFDSAAPGTLTGDVALSGVPANVTPIALEFRPGTAGLILVGNGPTANECQLYTVNTSTGAVTPVGAAMFVCTGGVTEIDVNPSVDRVRVFKGAENYRVNPADGVKTADTAAAYVTGDAGAGTTPDVLGAAYDQNTAAAPATTLFALEGAKDALVRVGSVNGTPNSPNTGELTTIGGLGIDISFGAPFDISAATGTAYLFTFDLPFAAGTNGKLRTVNLTTGAASAGVKIGTDSLNLLGMAVAPGITLAQPTGSGGTPAGGGGSGGGLGLLSLLGLLPALAARWRKLKKA